MSTKIRQCFAVTGVVCLVLIMGFTVATPFLPLSPFWQQLAVGLVLVELQMVIWLGPAMTSRITRLRQEMLSKGANANRLPPVQQGVYYVKAQPAAYHQGK